MSRNTSFDSPFEREQFQPGLGTYSLTGEDGAETIAAALEAGYRHVDTARLYGNESEVGEALQRANVDRQDILLATKVAHEEEPEKTPEYVRRAVAESLDRLSVEPIDVVYHHWPRNESQVETVLPVIEEFVDEGLVEHIAVSNYPIRYLEKVEDLIDIPIAANQIEMHPLFQQEELYTYLHDRDIPLVAYSPVAQGKVADVDELHDIAEKHESSPYAVSLAWLLQKEGVTPIPRSSSLEHIKQNLASRELTLDDEDIEKIESIDRIERLEDPDWMDW